MPTKDLDARCSFDIYIMIIITKEAITISRQLRNENKKIVLVGGCFDIIHLGHVRFLQKAKERGDVLMVMLESDERIRQTKGADRPYNIQQERAEVLESIRYVDYVICLDYIPDNTGYDLLVKSLEPAIIATTRSDPHIEHKKRQAEAIGAEVIFVIDRITGHSTSTKAQQLYKHDEL